MLERSQDSSFSVVTGVGARRRGIVAPFPARQDLFIFPQTFVKRQGTTESPVQWVPGLLTRRINWLGDEDGHSSLLVSRLRMREAVPPLPHVPSWHAQGLRYILLERVACFAV